MSAAVDPGRLALLVPADTKADTVRRRSALARVQALVDQRAVALDQQLFEPDRRARVGEPATHRQGLAALAWCCDSGILGAMKSALEVRRARITSALRSPSMRASAYASSAASVSPEPESDFSSAVLRSASETNGTPPASSAVASDSACRGIDPTDHGALLPVAVTGRRPPRHLRSISRLGGRRGRCTRLLRRRETRRASKSRCCSIRRARSPSRRTRSRD